MSAEAARSKVEELEDFIGKYMEIDRETERPRSFFEIVSGGRERRFHDALKYFINPNELHGFGRSILYSFLDSISNAPKISFDEQYKIEDKRFKIFTEVTQGDEDKRGRVDLIIVGGERKPEWMIVCELKVDLDVTENQLEAYDNTDSWSLTWHDDTEIDLNEKHITKILIKTKDGKTPDNMHGFEDISWSKLVEGFENKIGGGVFDYPHRSVVQFLDFIRAVKKAEDEPDSVSQKRKQEKIKMADLYFKNEELIQNIDQAENKFDKCFEELANLIQENWVEEITELLDLKYSLIDGEGDWYGNINTEWGRISPKYWKQSVEGYSRNINVSFLHRITGTNLKNGKLEFKLWIPPSRNVHKAFNDVFTDKLKLEGRPKNIRLALQKEGLKEPEHIQLNSSKNAIRHYYPVAVGENIYKSYFDSLKTACKHFCMNEDLLNEISKAFKEAFEEVFPEEELQGERLEPLK